MCNRVWRGEGWPERWKEGIIVQLVKKGTGDRVENYRGVTLMPTLYVGILTERLKKEMEEENMMPESQTLESFLLIPSSHFRKKKFSEKVL